MKQLRDMTEPELGVLMRVCAKSIELACTELGVEKPLFALLLFNDPQIAQYIANCQRSDVITAMRECAQRIERRQDVPR